MDGTHGTRKEERGARRLLPLALIAPFVLLATLNSAGYRYGASDQAFYIPATLARLDPSLFPRDQPLIESQAKLTRIDETMAAAVRATGVSVPVLSFALYVLSLTFLAAAGWSIGRRLYRTTWAAIALLAALTLRHAIAKSGTNTLEAYFHPRQLAFGLGALAVASFLRGRLSVSAALVIASGFLHPTTAMWFTIWLSVAAAVSQPRLRRPLTIAAALGAAAGVWALTIGPLAGRLIVMDPEWLATLATKDYLFPLQWPLTVWLLNLAYIPIIVFIYRTRAAAGLVTIRETAVVAGCLSLVIVFAAALPFIGAHVALAVQLQTARIFWMLDFMAVVYTIWAVAEGPRPSPRRAAIAAAVLALASLTRGAWVMFVKFPERRVVQLRVADDDWGRVMAWTRATPPDAGWLADPMHAVKYGTSVRVAGERDVLVEAVKDAAIGMYTRGIATRTEERLAAIGPFETLTPERALTLATRYDLDYLVTEQPLDLPMAFESGALKVYRLTAAPAGSAPARPPR